MASSSGPIWKLPELGGRRGGRFYCASPLRPAARRKRVAAHGRTGRPRTSCVAMDVGADEFEQSLPLLQELVLGADFVGKAPGFRALSQEETPVPASLRWV